MKRSRKIMVAALVVALMGSYGLTHASTVSFGGKKFVSLTDEKGVGSPPRLGGNILYYVNKSNIEKYKDKLPEGAADMVVNWDRTIPVYPTVRDYVFPKEYLEATEKYKGTAKVDANGGIQNYTAGLPFPDPKTGAEAMYNTVYRYTGDDLMFWDYDFWSISRSGKTHKVGGRFFRLNYEGRVYVDPKPSIPNPYDIESKDIAVLTYPEDVAGLALLTVRYKDPKKTDDGWMYIPTIRRVRRISVAQRGDTMAGLDFTWDDYRGFSGKVADYNWKLIGKKEMLIAYHYAGPLKGRIKGNMLDPQDDRFELRPVIVVEGVPKAKGYVYSKRRVYIDPDSWGITHYEMYDPTGKLWKSGEYRLQFDPKNNNAFGDRNWLVDLIAKRSTIVFMPDRLGPLQDVNLGFTEDLFTPAKIQTISR